MNGPNDMHTRYHATTYPRHVSIVLVDDIPDEEDTRNHSDNNDQGDKVTLTSLIRMNVHPGMAPLTAARRNHVAPCVILHHDTWDAVLCEGVPVSLRELVSLTLVQLKLADTDIKCYNVHGHWVDT